MTLSFNLNGKAISLDVPSDLRLVEILRERLHETATKVACGVGRCGACTVLMDGRAANSCLVMAYQLDGAKIVTVQGLDALPSTAIILRALAEENAFQCGYCAPGFSIALSDLLANNPEAGEAEIRAGLSGNICRCTGYHSIIRGALKAAELLRRERMTGDLT